MQIFTKLNIITFTILLLSSTYYAQHEVDQEELIGIWQADKSELGSGWGDNYQFFEDNTFQFNYNSMSSCRRRIWGVIGNYKLSENKLILTINAALESSGGYIRPGDKEEGEDEFEIAEEKLKIVKQNKLSEITFDIKSIGENEDAKKIIKINERVYFKMHNDPNNYE